MARGTLKPLASTGGRCAICLLVAQASRATIGSRVAADLGVRGSGAWAAARSPPKAGHPATTAKPGPPAAHHASTAGRAEECERMQSQAGGSPSGACGASGSGTKAKPTKDVMPPSKAKAGSAPERPGVSHAGSSKTSDTKHKATTSEAGRAGSPDPAHHEARPDAARPGVPDHGPAGTERPTEHTNAGSTAKP
jgi:hypothetical protein